MSQILVICIEKIIFVASELKKNLINEVFKSFVNAIEVKFYDMLSSGQGYTEHLGVQIVRTMAPIISLGHS